MAELARQQVADVSAGAESLVLGAHILNHNLEVVRTNKM